MVSGKGSRLLELKAGVYPAVVRRSEPISVWPARFNDACTRPRPQVPDLQPTLAQTPSPWTQHFPTDTEGSGSAHILPFANRKTLLSVPSRSFIPCRSLSSFDHNQLRYHYGERYIRCQWLDRGLLRYRSGRGDRLQSVQSSRLLLA